MQLTNFTIIIDLKEATFNVFNRPPINLPSLTNPFSSDILYWADSMAEQSTFPLKRNAIIHVIRQPESDFLLDLYAAWSRFESRERIQADSELHLDASGDEH